MRSGSLWSDDSDRRRRKSVLMDSSLQSFKSMMQGTERFLDTEIEELPIRVADRWSLFSKLKKPSKVEPEGLADHWKRRVSKDINPLLLIFRNMDWNWEYFKEHDPLFKHYILASFIILNFMGIILITTSYNIRPHVILWVMYVIIFIFLVYLIPCTWISYIWDQIIDPQFDLDYISQPDNPVIKFFYQASGTLNTNSLFRNLIFMFVSVMMVASSVVDIIFTPCRAESPRNYTYRCSLALMSIFMYLRINLLIKVFVTICCLLLFGLIITGSLGNPNVKYFFSMDTFGFDHWLSGSVNPELNTRNWSHFLYILGVAIFLILSDRQKEYIHRLDYMWKRQLKKDQEEANNTKFVNKILLQNILPQHVADIYLNSEREAGKLFSESYESVGVMFASLPNYINFFSEAEINQGGEKPLTVLNDIISSFDRILLEPQLFNRVEKIKIIGGTFMAAAGLNPGRKDSMDSRNQIAASCGANARTLAKFAAAMMRKLAHFDYSKFELENTPDFKLRVGIQAGPVIAGVVGAQKPLYDIWGDTVNVASRMDYTGERGFIHIPEKTAMALQELDPKVKCRFRDRIQVKGKGMMDTYFVELTPDLHIVEEDWTQEEREYARIYENISQLPGVKMPSPTGLDLVQGSRFQVQATKEDNNGEILEEAELEMDPDAGQDDIKKQEHEESFPKPTGILKLGTKKRSQAEDVDVIYSLGEEVIQEEEEKPKNLRWKEKTGSSAKVDVPATVDEVEVDGLVPGDSPDRQETKGRGSREWTAEEIARLEEKKDSGYGSQGVLKVNKSLENDEEVEGVLKKSRPQPEPVPPHMLAEHYEVYYNRNDTCDKVILNKQHNNNSIDL